MHILFFCATKFYKIRELYVSKSKLNLEILLNLE